MENEGIHHSGSQYSRLVGFIFIFNLIVGTGALTMPAAFKEAGWLLSLISIIVLAFMSFLTLTFMTETMAISNAKIRFQKLTKENDTQNDKSESINDADERTPLRPSPMDEESTTSGIDPCFEITQRIELGVMAKLYFNNVGMAFFHLCVIIYLYGDLAIYAAAVPKSLRDVVCTYVNATASNASVSDDDPCWSRDINLNRMQMYRIFVGGFLLFLGPFVFFNVQKTTYLQVLTSLTRWISLILMIILAFIQLGQGKCTGHPSVADFSGVPNLFGVCVYSFMCHHSLPSLITPIKNKTNLLPMIAGDFALILIFYALISFSAVFAADKIFDIYTLNFKPHDSHSITSIVPFQYFIVLFPVLTLSTNFPIIAITLRNNLIALFTQRYAHPNRILFNVICPLLALIPPVIIAIITNQIEALVGITGSYAGAGIQYVLPTTLVFFARKDIVAAGKTYRHKSPFAHRFWVFLVLGWAVMCIGFVTVNHIITKK